MDRQPQEPQGLTRREAAERLRRDGPNALATDRGPAPWRHLLRQMVHFFALLLWVASALAFLAGMPELGAAIAVVVVVNGLLAFAQEHRAERAAGQLARLLPRRVLVMREGRLEEIDSVELVVGDRIVLRTGDRVSADVRVCEAHSLLVSTAALTGESVPVPVEADGSVHAGALVMEGEGEALVTAVGGSTRLAELSKLTRAARRPLTPLARELRRVARIIAAVALALGAVFLGVALLVGIPLEEGLVFAIGVSVALVPEALLPTVTLSAAIGAQRMARRHALVRRLESVETLGSTTFVCTDKTGTLTLGEMSVVEVWTPAGMARVEGRGYDPEGAIELSPPSAAAAVRRLALVAARCSNGRVEEHEGQWIARGNPMEAALDVLARRAGVEVDRTEGPAISRRFPFDPRRRRMSVVAGSSLFVKGAPDAVLPRCEQAPAAARSALTELTAGGLRVLAIAERTLVEGEELGDANRAEQELTLLGLVGLEDPPRVSAARAITDLRRAGVKVAMITGDHPATARAIAREVGLLGPAGVVVTGAELPAEERELASLVDHDGIVVSRAAPEDKLRIALALRSRGHVVAMTGDGVNDGPALQAADVGVAMGRGGTDVAREAADLVLLDDDLSTVVAAVEHGRATYDNVRRFLTYHLTDNVAEVTPFLLWALSGGQLPLALGVLQVLALDIGTDTFSAVALGAEPPERRVLERPPPRRHLLDAQVARRAFAVLGPVEAAMSMAAFAVGLLAAGWRPGAPFPSGGALAAASGAAFAAVVVGQAANAFACRSESRWALAPGWRRSRTLVAAVGVAWVLGILFLVAPPLPALLQHALPPAPALLVALLAGPAVLAADAGEKALRRRWPRRHPHDRARDLDGSAATSPWRRLVPRGSRLR